MIGFKFWFFTFDFKELQKVEPAATEKEPKLIVSEDVHEESEGVNHFRQILKEETEKLDSLCHKWEDVNAETADLSEDGKDY